MIAATIATAHAPTSVRAAARFEERVDEVGEHPVADEHAERVAARQSGAPVEEHDFGERELGATHGEAERRVEQRSADERGAPADRLDAATADRVGEAAAERAAASSRRGRRGC